LFSSVDTSVLLPDPLFRRIMPSQQKDGAIHYRLAHPYPS
jgi:hypothetical protein